MNFLNNQKLPLAFISLLFSTVLLRQTGFSLIDEVAIAIHTIFLIVLSLLTAWYYYQKKQFNTYDMFLIVGASLSTFFLIRDTPVLGTLVILLILLVSLSARYRKSRTVKIVVDAFAILTIIIGALVFVLSLILEGSGVNNEVQTLNSADGKYQLAIEKLDAGATGGGTEVTVKRLFGRYTQWKRSLYSVAGALTLPLNGWTTTRQRLMGWKLTFFWKVLAIFDTRLSFFLDSTSA